MDKTAAKEAALLERVKALLEDGKLAMAFQPEDEDEEVILPPLNLLYCQTGYLCGQCFRGRIWQMTAHRMPAWLR